MRGAWFDCLEAIRDLRYVMRCFLSEVHRRGRVPGLGEIMCLNCDLDGQGTAVFNGLRFLPGSCPGWTVIRVSSCGFFWRVTCARPLVSLVDAI